jgi:hypothetical protein
VGATRAQPHRAEAEPIPPEVRAWRYQVLRQAGFARPLARELAGQAGVDLHDLLRLVDRGCPPELAARIVV